MRNLMRCVVLAGVVASSGQAPDAKPGRVPYDPDSAAARYLDGVRAIDRKAKGMTRDHAAAFRKAARPALVKKLTREFGVTEGQLGEAVRDYQFRPAREAAEKAERQAELAWRLEQARPGATGVLDAKGVLAKGYFGATEAETFLRADDETGFARMVEKRQIVLVDRPTGVRILEAFDSRAIGKGFFVRVRVLDGPRKDEEAYCFPAQVASPNPRPPAPPPPPPAAPRSGMRRR